MPLWCGWAGWILSLPAARLASLHSPQNSIISKPPPGNNKPINTNHQPIVNTISGIAQLSLHTVFVALCRELLEEILSPFEIVVNVECMVCRAGHGWWLAVGRWPVSLASTEDPGPGPAPASTELKTGCCCCWEPRAASGCSVAGARVSGIRPALASPGQPPMV